MGYFDIFGFGGGNTGDAKRQEDLTRQQEEYQVAVEQVLSQLSPDSPEHQQFLEIAQRLGRRLSEGPFMVPELGRTADQREAILALGPQFVRQQQDRIAGASGPLVRNPDGSTTQLAKNQAVPEGSVVIAESGVTGPGEQRTEIALQGLRDQAQRVPFEEDVFRVLTGEEPQTAFGKQMLTGLSPSQIEQELLNALEGNPTNTPIGQVFSQVMARAQEPRGESDIFKQGLDLVGGRLEDRLAGRTAEPVDDSVFQNALKLVEDRVNEEYAARGALGGGLRLEGLGRAGTEAAIAEAQRQDQLRQQQYLQDLGLFNVGLADQQRQDRLGQEAYANAVGLSDVGRSIPANIRDFVSSLFNVGEGLRDREIGLEGDLVNIQLGRESRLTDLLERSRTNSLNATSSLLQRQTARAENFTDFFTELQEADKRFLRDTAADLGIAALGGNPPDRNTGGVKPTSVSPIPDTRTPQSVTPSGQLSPEALLSQQRSGTTSRTSTTAPSLSRQPQDDDLARLLAQLFRSNQQTRVA